MLSAYPACFIKEAGGYSVIFPDRSQNVFELCKECPFVKCCKERSVDFCSKCPEYPCKEILDYQVKYVNKCNQI